MASKETPSKQVWHTLSAENCPHTVYSTNASTTYSARLQRGHAPPLLCKLLSSLDTPEISCIACRFYVNLLDFLFPRICLKPRYSTRLSLKQPLHTQRSPMLFYRLVRALEITIADWTSASTKYDRPETYEVQKL